ncbi:MAG: tetratricopeptide repeat protein [Anaerolineales bacterium]|nr:tetratricopeptide repeat protein [Anaerolineales bacterium]
MGEIINPYIAGAPVTEQRMFFGREDIFQWIENSIAGQYADHILVLHGQRRVGKTSVLKQLSNRLPHRYIPVFFDLQGRTHTTLDHFLWWLAREIVRVLKQERAIEVPPPPKESFTTDPEFFENQFLTSLQAHLGSDTLLLTFDEFDNLEESEVREELARPLIDHLRRLMGHPNLNFIFSIGSSGRKLENMQAAYTDFFKTALYKKISFLSEEQTDHLVTRPVAGVIEYERPAVDRIYQIASGHPYFTQLTCHELFARCQRTEQRKIAVADVESVLDDVVERGTVNLKFVWDEASDIEKWSLAALVQLEKTDNRTLAEFLRRNHVRFSETDLTSGLLRLREKDVLTPQNRFVIHLLHIWLQKNRPIEQVREELTESNPIANRFIEIGLEFRDGGQPEKAIEFFRQALSVASDNLQAQVNIALTYAVQGHLEQAIAEFEKALTIDDEDVASRSGLCDAHLALGDAAMKRGRVKDAVLSYQRVLAINAEHLEARGRMAELSRQRAEKALAGGRDEEALSAFAEALKFTPEDQALIARSEKVRAEKNAKVLADQISRSEKEAAARNWAKAVEALNAALEIAPGDASILKRIETINQSQLRERLDALLSKVAAAEKTERWDAAIGGLNEYLQLKPDDTAVQKRIADLVEARHTAWQKAVLERVDHAVADRNWDAALSALNEALRLEPDNAVMQARAGQVRAERRTAELNARLARAESAISAGRWDEAIEVLNDGLAAEPENETLKTKLAEARKARRESRLQAALRLAESAAQAGKWETAAASLQEVLLNEPDNPEFIQKLAEIKMLERESRLGGLETLAQSLLKAEKFDEALAAWNEYLALLPADREKAQAEIAAVKKAQTLASLYVDAASAHAGRNYEKAIELFKRIVAEDAEYKDTTDLLAEAVRLRRSGSKTSKIVFKKSWLVGGLLAGLALGVGALVVWVARTGLPAMPAVTTDNTKTPTSAAQPASTVISALDPAIQSALDTIQNEDPLYQTNFDDWDTEETDPNAALVNGKLMLTGRDENGVHFALNTYPSDNFVVEFDIGMSALINGNCFYGAGNGVPPGGSYRGFTMEFYPEGSAVLARYVPESGLDVRLAAASFDKTRSNTITLVVLGDHITAFINGQLAYSALDYAGSVVYVTNGFAAYNQAVCEFDNFKYWDLRDMDSAFKTALAATQNEQPLYQTSFDAWEFGEPEHNAGIVAGKLVVPSEGQEHTAVPVYDLVSDGFAAEFNLHVTESSPEGHCIFETGDGVPGDAYRAISVEFHADGRAALSHHVGGGVHEVLAESRYDIEIENNVTLFILGDQIAVFIDGRLAYTAIDPDGSAMYVHQSLSASSGIGCEYDNFKIWDMGEVDSAVRIALAAIQSEEPLYQTSFDAWDFGDPVENAKVENGKLVLSTDSDINTFVPLDNFEFNSKRFAFEFETQLLESLDDAGCSLVVGSTDTYFSVNFRPSGQVRVVHPKDPDDLIIGSGKFDPSISNAVTLFVLDDRFSLFINDELAFTALDPEGSTVYTYATFRAFSTVTCEFDNYKFWDLSGVDFSAATTATGTKSFFGSALAWVAGKTPDYEDDFSDPSSGWTIEQNSTGNEVRYLDGEYFISAKDICYGASLPTDPVFSDFFLEMDAGFINQGKGSATIIFRDDGTSHFGVNIFPMGLVGFHKNINGTHTDLLYTEVPASSFQSWNTPKHLTLIARQNQLAIYINGKLVIAQADTSSSQGTFYFLVCDDHGDNLQVLIDNLKIWDITDLSP